MTSSLTTLIATGLLSWSLVGGSLPAGLTLNSSTGAITGIPTQTGTFNLTFQVTDPLGGQAQKNLTLTIK
jgi:hypothetical protein